MGEAPRESRVRTPAFVVIAAPKSGTTWMQLMLSAHPEAHCAELRAWGQEYVAFDRGDYHVTLDHYASFLATLARLPAAQEQDGECLAEAMQGAALEWIADRTRKPVVGEKVTPRTGGSRRTLERILELDSATPVIHLVRDPRDVVVSGVVHHSWALPAEDTATREEIVRAVDRGVVPEALIGRWIDNWNDVVSAVIAAEDAGARVLTLRYEDLVEDCAGHLRRVLEHIGIDRSRAVVDACVASAAFERLSGRRSGIEDRRSFFRKGQPGDWVNWLTPEQSERVAERAGARFAELYAEQPSGGSLAQ